MPDVIEKLDHSLIQHGPDNDRIYLMKLAPEDAGALPTRLKAMAEEKGYSKVFAKVPAGAEEGFLNVGFETEARAEGFFRGEQDAAFMGLFLKPWRRECGHAARVAAVVAAAKAKACPAPEIDFPDGYECRICEPTDVQAMAEVYRVVFESYPFPIHDPAYLAETMAEHIHYFGVWADGRLVGLSSCETDPAAKNVEMTDFAVLPDQRGKSLAVALLGRMEPFMREHDFRTAYTIARATSFGMNIAFARAGYAFGGTLINNTHISGGFESMNVWCKPLAEA